MDFIEELLQRATDIEEMSGVDSDTLSEVAYWTGYLEALRDYAIELKDIPKGLRALLDEFNV